MTGKKGWGLLAVWVAALMVGLWFYGDDKIVPFDPNFSLNRAAASDDFDHQFVDMLKSAGIQPGSLVHIQASTPCYCNTLSNIHQQALLSLLKNDGYQWVTLNIENIPALAPWVPTFPALAVIDMKGKLRYLGPYATGIGCFTGDDLVNDIAAMAKQTQPLGAVINSEAEGCYCPTQSQP
ncbi:DUF6436 domain-containing protein [Alteromonas sp. 14N.309.X.WAT.G.H12]|uniref:DUF6436 domain-containing protein n=1 Tax=Alteromonas sp. 14N.309.X.WAT.G.H12 TaxID=3120824 RepID=UPI002FCFB132